MSPSSSTEFAAPPAPGLAQRVRGPLLSLGAAGVVSAALLLRDPHVSGSWGYCPFLVLTGHPCPACGGLRATDDVLHGDVAAATGSNAYVVLTAAVAAGLWVLWLVRGIAGRGATWTPLHGRLAIAWVVGLLAFGVLRLLPGLSALQP